MGKKTLPAARISDDMDFSKQLCAGTSVGLRKGMKHDAGPSLGPFPVC